MLAEFLDAVDVTSCQWPSHSPVTLAFPRDTRLLCVDALREKPRSPLLSLSLSKPKETPGIFSDFFCHFPRVYAQSASEREERERERESWVSVLWLHDVALPF